MSEAEVRRAVDRLRALRGKPEERAQFAAELVQTTSHPGLLQAALEALDGRPVHGVKAALLERYQQLDEQGPKRDAGGMLRAGILRVLDGAFTHGDAPLMERAVRTFEPTPGDAAAPTLLRSAGLVALDSIDPESARYLAAMMLAAANDPRQTSAMSGEPAATAVRVLASRGESLVLVTYLLAHARRTAPAPSEVLAECVRSLADVPGRYLEPVIDAVREWGDEVVELGLCDLVVAHEPERALTEWAGRFLRGGCSLELYRYLATAVVASRRRDLFEVLARAAEAEPERKRIEVLIEALALGVHEPGAGELIEKLKARAGK